MTTQSKYPLFRAHCDIDAAMLMIEKVMRSGYMNEGVEVTQFQNEISRFLGRGDNLIVLNSCTSALTLALRLAGVGPGDDVVTTPMTCVATNTPIVAAGANIVWADIDPYAGVLTPHTIKQAITPNTKAVIFVAWAGNPGDMEDIYEVCRRNNIKLIIDAAHAFGAKYDGKCLSEFCDFACYSFQAIKHITTGDGGAIVCKSNDDVARARALKWFGLDRDKAKDEKGNWKGQQWDVDISEAGYKFNMNNIAAAIGLSQIPHIDRILSMHRQNASYYDRAFIRTSRVIPLYVPPRAQSSNWVYTVYVSSANEEPRRKRDLIVKALNDEGIAAGLVHVPNDTYTCFKKSVTPLPGVRNFSERQFSIPCGWWLNQGDIEYIASRVIYHAENTP